MQTYYEQIHESDYSGFPSSIDMSKYYILWSMLWFVFFSFHSLPFSLRRWLYKGYISQVSPLLVFWLVLDSDNSCTHMQLKREIEGRKHFVAFLFLSGDKHGYTNESSLQKHCDFWIPMLFMTRNNLVLMMSSWLSSTDFFLFWVTDMGVHSLASQVMTGSCSHSIGKVAFEYNFMVF